MKRILLSKNTVLLLANLLLFSWTTMSAQDILAQWDFQDNLEAENLNTNVNASDVTISSGNILFQNGEGGRIGYAATWSQEEEFDSETKHLSFSITPSSGFELTITELKFKFGRTAAGPQKVRIQYSLNNFETDGITILNEGSVISTATNALDPFSITENLPTQINNTITIKIWGYSATGTGNFRFTDFEIHGTVTESNQVSAPTFSPNGGTFYEDIEVSIASATDEASIFFKTEEADDWTAYSGAITVAETTTIWAYAEKTDMDNSDVANATFTFPEVIDIADIETLRAAPQDGTAYRLTGEAILTFASSNRNQKFIQDATGAILIDDASGIITTQYDLLDGIQNIIGTINEFQDMIQFIPVTNAPEASSKDNHTAPEVVTLEDLTTAHQGKLVTIIKTTVDPDGHENFTSGTTYGISDDTGTGSLRVYTNDLDFVGTTIPLTPQDITGVIHQRFTELRLIPRFAADITPSSTVSIPGNESGELSLFPNPVQDILTINAIEVINSVEVFNTVGSLVASSVENAGSITVNMSNLPGGIYLVKLTYADGSVTVKKVVKQ